MITPTPQYPWQIEQQLTEEARSVTPENLPTFLKKAAASYQGAFLSAKVTQALLHNPLLPLELIATSHTSPELYKSILHHINTVSAPIDATHTTKDIGQLFSLLVNDPLFSSIDENLFKIFTRTVAEKSPLANLSQTRVKILSLCTPGRFSMLNTVFIEAAYQDFIPEEIAQGILRNLLNTHTYPFLDRYRFFLHVLERVGERMFHAFLLQEFRAFIPSSFHREEVLLQLAEGSFYDFPVFYFKNEYKLTADLNRKHSQQLKRAKILCYKKLTILQKLFSSIPIFM